MIAQRRWEWVAWLLLLAALGGCIALILEWTRGATLWPDEQAWFVLADDYSADSILEAHNGHLIATTRLLFTGVLDLYGPDENTLLRILGVISWWLNGVLVFVFARRRLGAAAALPLAVLIVFLGTAPVNLIGPGELPINLCLAFGLGAIVVLDRPRTGFLGDVLACLLLGLSVASWTPGLAFVAAVAVMIALRPHPVRRAWVVILPVALYVPWYLEVRETGPTSSGADLDNLDELAHTLYVGLATGMTALTGLGHEWSGTPVDGKVHFPFGFALVALALVALVWRLSRGRIPAVLWGVLALLAAYWVMLTLTIEHDIGRNLREPDLNRYVGVSAIGLLLAWVAGVGARAVRPSVMVAIYVLAAASIFENLALLKGNADYFRDGYSPQIKAETAAIEVGGESMGKAYLPVESGGALEIFAGPYLKAVRRWGSPLGEGPPLEATDDLARVDLNLARGYKIRTERAMFPIDALSGCRTRPGGAIRVPPGGAVFSVDAPRPIAVHVWRFGGGPVPVGRAAPGVDTKLPIRKDRFTAEEPWTLYLPGARSVRFCPVPAS